jgi:tRNA(Ile2) C34 agmatinyltransferase TiaS
MTVCQCTNPDPSTCTACRADERALALTSKTCPTCGKTMEHIGRGVYVCPTARTEARGISELTRASIRTMVAERVAGVSF